MPLKNTITKQDLAAIISADIGWQQFNNKRVLITGANGFLPAYMVETLLYLNNCYENFHVEVVALVRNKEKALRRFIDYAADGHLFFIEQDVCDEIKIESGVDFIIHAASQASPKYYGKDPVGTLSANVLGTINLMKLAQAKKVTSFLYFSSGEIYGHLEDKAFPVVEDNYGYIDPLNVRSCYGESKRMGETICVSWYHQYGVNVKIVRPFHTYGPGMMLDDGRVYADFVSNILHKENIVLNSDGSARRAFCYLADATVGFFTVLLKGDNGVAYNVGNPTEEYSIVELANILITLNPELNLKVVMQLPEKNSDAYLQSPLSRNTPDIKKINSIGWSPTTTAKEGFTKTINSFINNQ